MEAGSFVCKSGKLVISLWQEKKKIKVTHKESSIHKLLNKTFLKTN